MKKILFAFFVFCLFAAPGLYAGTYTLDNQSIHLQGDTAVGKTLWLESQVKIQFNHLKLAWDHTGKVDKIRYDISCLDGKAILQNVKYIDDAVDSHNQIRWEQSDEDLNKDFSFIKDDRDNRRDNNVKYSSKLAIAPANYKNAKIEFHILASGRHYIVTWSPFKQTLSATWKRV